MLHFKQIIFKGVGLIIAGMLLFGCARQSQKKPAEKKDKEPQVTEAIATIHPAEGEEMTGTVTFTKTENGTKVEANLNNLSQGKHGFHIHEYGNCSDRESLASAGGHYNPANQPHASPTSDQRHVGDMGNIPAGPEGNGELTYTDPIIQLNGKHSVVGRAVVIHSGEDDLESQPSGAAGSRIGCGVIGITSMEMEADTGSGNNM